MKLLFLKAFFQKENLLVDQVIGNIRVALVSVIVLWSWRKMSLLFCVRVCFLKIKIF